MSPRGDSLQYGLYSLPETYMDFIHSNIFNQGTTLDLSKVSFVTYMRSIFYYFDYRVLLAFTQNCSDIKLIAIFSYNDEKSRIAKEWTKKNYSVKKDNAFIKETIGDLRLCMSTFSINEHDYMLCSGFDAGKLILRSTEIRFHFIIAMFTTFNHSVLEKRNDITELPLI